MTTQHTATLEVASPTAPLFDTDLPTFVVLVEGKVLFRTQTPGRAFQAIQALKHGRKAATLTVENDRRSSAR